MVEAVEGSHLVETVILEEDANDIQSGVPMTDTTFLFPEGTKANNTSFNNAGKFTDAYSLVA